MRLLTPVIFVLSLAALLVAGGVLWAGWTFRQFEPPGAAVDLRCTPVVGIAGASDAAIVPGTASAFLSTFDRRGGAARGELVLFDTKDPLASGSWRDRTGGVPAAFVPSGIDLYTARLADSRTLRRLFVVNLAGPEVLLFDVDEQGGLVIAERFSHPELTSPNDVVATGPRSFYVTNDTAAGRTTWQGKADFLLGLETGTVMRYDGSRWSEAASGLAFPNGLVLSEDGKTLYVAETRGRALDVYARDPETNDVTRTRRMPLETFPNNLSVDGESVLVGALPQPLVTSAYGEGLRDRAASEVLRVTKEGQIEALFRDDGRRLSAVTGAVRLGDKLLIGSRAADRFLMCEA